MRAGDDNTIDSLTYQIRNYYYQNIEISQTVSLLPWLRKTAVLNQHGAKRKVSAVGLPY